MNRKIVMIAVISALLLLVACGESKTTGRRVSIPTSSAPTTPTGAVTTETASEPAAPTQTVETGQSAADALKELQENPTTVASVDSGAKSGTFYPPITTTATGADALKEKTRALFEQEVYVPGDIDADKDFGSKYYSNDGDPKNLPDEYQDADND